MKKNNNNIPLNYREKNASRISLLCSVGVLALLVFALHEIDYMTIRRPAIEAGKAAMEAKEEEEKAAKEPVITRVTVAAVGNSSFSQSVIESGMSDSGEWNYDSLFEHVKDRISGADLALFSQESTMTTDHEIAMYDAVTPVEVGTALASAGFDAVAASTNHVSDNGYESIEETMNFWETSHPEVKVLGVQNARSGNSRIQTFTINDITISLLNYSFNMIREGIPQGFQIDTLNTSSVSADLSAARAGSDFLIVIPHWGRELESMPTEFEKEWAAFFLKAGVDVVIGTHPYVLQPYGRLSDDAGHEMVVFYSLGNFITSRQDTSQVLGGLAEFTLEKTVSEEGTTLRVVSPKLTPLVMHYSDSTGSYGSYLLEEYTGELASSHNISADSSFTPDLLKQRFEDTMTMNVAPSEKTSYLDQYFDSEGNMTDQYGNYTEDTESITAQEYLQQKSSSSSSS